MVEVFTMTTKIPNDHYFGLPVRYGYDVEGIAIRGGYRNNIYLEGDIIGWGPMGIGIKLDGQANVQMMSTSSIIGDWIGIDMGQGVAGPDGSDLAARLQTFGEITSADTAVLGSKSLTVINGGTISGRKFGVKFESEGSTRVERLYVRNDSGSRIISEEGIAILGGDTTSDLVINAGRILGGGAEQVVIKMLGGDDELNTAGGIVVGEIHMGQGNDTVKGSNSARDVVRGQEGDDFLFGFDGDDYLEGGQGSDVISGGGGIDTTSYWDSPEGVKLDLGIDGMNGWRGFAEGDQVTGIEHIIGSAFNDTITGGAEDNWISGGEGTDILQGGNGADILVVDNENDKTSDAGTDGKIDTVRTTVNHTIGDGIENLENHSQAGLILTGNALSNHIKGGDGADTIDGGATGTDVLEGRKGDDTYHIRSKTQTVTERAAEGSDTVQVYIDSYELGANLENVEAMAGRSVASLKGNNLRNVIVGKGGDNKLEGKGGNDLLQGGGGTDTAVFSGKRSDYTVVEKAKGTFEITHSNGGADGVDTVLEVEYFQFSDMKLGAANVVTPPAPVNPIPDTSTPTTPTTPNPIPVPLPVDVVRTGTKHRDVLVGGAGNDKLNGKLGKDVLTGGAGKDVFVFNTKAGKSNVDWITDFNVKDDTIYLDNAIFKNLGKGSASKLGKLNKKFFKIGNESKDGNDYLFYKKSTGALFYDKDGSGEAAAVQIAKLSKNLKLTVKDFMII